MTKDFLIVGYQHVSQEANESFFTRLLRADGKSMPTLIIHDVSCDIRKLGSDDDIQDTE